MSTPPKTVDSPQDAAGCSLPASPCSSLLDLRLADCMDVMRDAPDNHWDLAIVDPPYGMGVAMGCGYKNTPSGQKRTRNRSDGLRDKRKRWDDAAPDGAYFSELRRVARNQIIWGGNHFANLLPSSRCWHSWDKKQPDGMSFSQFELAWTSFDSICKTFRMYPTHVAQGVKIHPTQKPVKLYDWLLKNHAKTGDRILDTHMGSGSIAIACHYAGHHLTACEIDPDYYAAACERIERETRQLDFFSTNK